MADLTVRINQTREWTCSGTSDVLSCTDISQPLRNGVQVETDFDMHTADVTVKLPSGIAKAVTVSEHDKKIALIGKDFSMSEISITGVPAGTYTVRFSQ